jgi:hypothetical protein
MADIGKIQRAIANAQAAGDTAAVGRLQQLLAEEQARGTPQTQSGRSWGDVAGQAIMNLPSSGAKYVSDLTSVVTDPLGTLQAVGDLGAGTLRAGAQAVLPETAFNFLDSLGNPEDVKRAAATASAVGNMYADRYGSMEGFKKALAEDPVGVAADLSLPVTGAGGVAAKAPGISGRVGRTVAAVGRNMDPVTAASNVASRSGAGVRAVVGTMTGTGDEPLREGYNAARAGGARGQAFYDNMRGDVPQRTVVTEAMDALDNIKETRGRNYRANMASTRASTAPVDLMGVAQTLRTTLDDMQVAGNWTGGPVSRRTAQMVVNDLVNWAGTRAGQTPGGLDGLKKRISNYVVTPGPGVSTDRLQANRIAEIVVKALDAEIRRADPNYANTMRQYAEASDLIRELQTALSLNDKASTDTTLRKLQSTMRNNVQTNYGERINLARELEAAGADTLMPALAGQALNQLAPRGLARVGAPTAAGMAALGGYMTNPAMMAALIPAGIGAVMSSPRLMGEVAGLLGTGARQADRLTNAMPQSVRSAAKASTGRPARFAAQEAGGIANEAEAMLEDAEGNVYDRKGRLIRRETSEVRQ